jgi:ClpA/ClpB-like protein
MTLSDEVQGVLHRAFIGARELGHAVITPEHLALEIIREDETAAYLERCGTNLVAVESRLRDYLGRVDPVDDVSSRPSRPPRFSGCCGQRWSAPRPIVGSTWCFEISFSRSSTSGTVLRVRRSSKPPARSRHSKSLERYVRERCRRSPTTGRGIQRPRSRPICRDVRGANQDFSHAVERARDIRKGTTDRDIQKAVQRPITACGHPDPDRLGQ